MSSSVEIPRSTNLYTRIRGSDLSVQGVAGDKDIELTAGDLTIQVGSPEDYSHVDPSVRLEDVSGTQFGDPSARHERDEEDTRLYDAGAAGMGERLHQRSFVQLDGDPGCGAGDGVALHHRQSRSDVASHYDLLCAWLRTLHRKYVFDSSRQIFRRSNFDESVVDLESDPRHSGQFRLRRTAHWACAVRHKHAEASCDTGNPVAS